MGELAGSIGHDPYDGGIDRSSFEKVSSQGSGESSELDESGTSLGSLAGV